MENRFFTSRDLVLMALFATMSSLAGLTTAFIPAPLPGLYAIIAIPVGTILLLVARDLVGKTGAAVFTQFISGIVSTILPGGPPVLWIILPTWIIGGTIVDLLLYLTRQKISDSRVASGILGVTYNIPGDLLLFWTFNAVLGWQTSLHFFLYGFIMIHSFLGGLSGLITPDILKRIKPAIG